MSSANKDARWALAYDFCESNGFEWDKVSYDLHQNYLTMAQRLLKKNPELVPYFAAKWIAEED